MRRGHAPSTVLVIARLDRAIQYAAPSRLLDIGGYWMPACAGMTTLKTHSIVAATLTRPGFAELSPRR
jgi:hypothetical protein